ncbi:hypothetical protein KsCSTR_18470 [Candidatus Kuenenia stuttgartiensis]|uniref:Mor transcription activator domain-containing protein n=1 Tax=Kuenenia stuttgartiensis TaxID=174633 RepID=A0A6G7GNW0_KUEST|nr:Mor transcription activator family protein [Candidatus Kuenenia stuttgartiensis]QII11226.1 hypothetical protein KsCSTR_18470 [Candidatus Kuenenia stuttgartiensis]
MNWLDNLTPEDFAGDLRLVADHCGVEVARSLAEKLKSIPIYIRPIEDVIGKRKELYIVKNFHGDNYTELAIATGFSERHVRKLINKHRTEERQKYLQRPLFPPGRGE